MTRFIVFANRKGGCGKTTSAVNVSHALAMRGRKVLLIDVDPQAHASISLENNLSLREHCVSRLLRGHVRLKDVIVPTHIKGLSLIPASSELSRFEAEFSFREGSDTRLCEQLSGGAENFDYVLFDPPPTTGLLMMSALLAAKEVCIPMQMGFLNLEGLAEMVRLICDVAASRNPNLRLSGVIPTFFNKNTRIAKEIEEDIIKHLGRDKLFPGIRMNISLSEAPGHGKSIFEYAPESSGAADYMALAERIDGELGVKG